ncbi:MAG: protein adenylyltransferase SelO [Alcanivoracaceae bacterium]
MPSFPFDNSYARLPEAFFRRCQPSPVSSPRLIRLNKALVGTLGLTLDDVDANALAQLFSGNVLPEGAEPLAAAYAGHQFGGFNPQLGDGRAILLGEVVDVHGRRQDVQLKGAGKTPFSRGGDGRSPLGPVIREYLVSEAMHALGVPTTRALAAVTTGDAVYRDGALPGAILTRVAASHIRVGTFQYIAARGEFPNLRLLADHVIDRHYPDLAGSDQRYRELLEAVVKRQAVLIANWMSIGFIHGVMNTDNMLVSGEAIDYGPCAFMDAYHPETVFSSIDTGGRYAYRMQPAIAQWNMARFAETLLPLLGENEAEAVEYATGIIRAFVGYYDAAWLERMRAKLGLQSQQDDDQTLIESLLAAMDAAGADFTLLFRSLAAASADPLQAEQPRAYFPQPALWDHWASQWQQRLARESITPSARTEAMRTVNPAVIPRNHRIEQAIEKATVQGDFSDFDRLLDILARPFDDQLAAAEWMGPPEPAERVCQTFCGT